MSTDSIADLITKIRNAQAARHEVVAVPYSKIKEAVANVLLAEGYLHKVKTDSLDKPRTLQLVLKYVSGTPAIKEIKRISKPGHRIYRGSKTLGKVRQGLGIGIVTTPQGIMSSRAARQKNLGGELICTVW